MFTGSNITEPDDENVKKWFAMRDLTRSNAKRPAHVILKERNIKCFTPMTWKLLVRNGKRIRKEMPYIHDLIFVYENRSTLDPIVTRTPTLQYRYLRNANRRPMTIREQEMEQFIKAVETTEQPHFYRPDEITPDMRKRKIRIIGGQLNGYEGFLITIRGSKVKRLLVELPTLLAVTVEIEPEYIQLI